jgi:hypothetical protein
MNDASGPPASGGTQQQTTSGAQDKAREATEQAQDKAQEVAGQAKEKAQEATQQAQGMVREQVDERSTQAGERISSTAGDLRSVGEELRKQGKDGPARLADQAAERTEKVGSYLSESDAERLLEDAEDFGRRQPLAVLAGGVALGLVAARFLKASSGSRYRSRSESAQQTRQLRAPQPPPPPPESVVGEPVPATVGSAPATAGSTP